VANHRQERFKWLADQFDALVLNLEVSADAKQRRQLLRRMKVLIDEIDDLILSSLKRDHVTARQSSPRET